MLDLKLKTLKDFLGYIKITFNTFWLNVILKSKTIFDYFLSESNFIPDMQAT